MSLSLLRSVAGSSMFGGLVRGAAINQVKGQIAEKISGVVSNKKDIDWKALNFPINRPGLGVIHFDLAELKEKRDEKVHIFILRVYYWFIAVCAVFLFNFMDSIILPATCTKYAYSPFAPAFSVIEMLILLPLAFGTLWVLYYGYAENKGREKTVGKVLLFILVFIFLSFAIASSGNINGFLGYKFAPFSVALDNGAAQSAVNYWKAVIAIESTMWLGLLGFTCYLLYVTFEGLSMAIEG
jgi:hypothetical protein